MLHTNLFIFMYNINSFLRELYKNFGRSKMGEPRKNLFYKNTSSSSTLFKRFKYINILYM